jgi:hypothetical protein
VNSTPLRSNTSILRLLAGAAASALLAIPATASTPSDALRGATLQAIHLIENPENLRTPGPFGELGAYQFRKETWRQYTKEPFYRALNRHDSDVVAVLHYEHLKSELESYGIPATPYTIAIAWHAGLGTAIRGRISYSVRNYAERAANLAEEFNRAAHPVRRLPMRTVNWPSMVPTELPAGALASARPAAAASGRQDQLPLLEPVSAEAHLSEFAATTPLPPSYYYSLGLAGFNPHPTSEFADQLRSPASPPAGWALDAADSRPGGGQLQF